MHVRVHIRPILEILTYQIFLPLTYKTGFTYESQPILWIRVPRKYTYEYSYIGSHAQKYHTGGRWLPLFLLNNIFHSTFFRPEGENGIFIPYMAKTNLVYG